MINHLLLVAFGGAIGALARYGVGLAVTHQGGIEGSWATLIVNTLGSGLMGALVAWLAGRGDLAQQGLWLLIGVGMLGAFTTFSSFSKDAVDLLLAGETARALTYITLNVVLSIGAFALSFLAFRGALS